ncbi:MAG TPA: helix-turn-helix transcriptional regulator [Bdellovibrio sp.]|uniref:helix-turn-helix transcriptional regulator n=1 Tax=Bdellovibrio sp. TaxID=28201 RepID=UPI002F149E23
MTTKELIEIDPAALRKFLENQNLSRHEFAERLGVSTKTVQRWVNESVRRVRPDTLERIAGVFKTTPDQLCKTSVPIETRPINRALEEICSENFLNRIRAGDEFPSYLKLLKSFNPSELCSAQKLTLFIHIGLTSFHLQKTKSSRLYFDEALKIANCLNEPEKAVSILTWSALRENFSGNHREAIDLIDRSEFFLPQTQGSLSARCEFLFRKAQVLYQSENPVAAIPMMRECILLEYKIHPTIDAYKLGVKYFHLSECYLRLRDYGNARRALLKSYKMAEKCGWVRGQSYSHYSLGIIRLFKREEPEHVRSSMNKARQLKAFTGPQRINTKAEHREFIYLVQQQKFDEAKAMVLFNIRNSRRYSYFLSYAILDGLFFAKIAPLHLQMRPSLIARAEDYFRRNNLPQSLKTLEQLKSKEQITFDELLELYVF